MTETTQDANLAALAAQAAAISNPHILQAAVSSERIWNTLTIKQPTPPVIQINGNDGQFIVAIHPDGRVELGPDVSTDEAARQFWAALTQIAGQALGGSQ